MQIADEISVVGYLRNITVEVRRFAKNYRIDMTALWYGVHFITTYCIPVPVMFCEHLVSAAGTAVM